MFSIIDSALFSEYNSHRNWCVIVRLRTVRILANSQSILLIQKWINHGARPIRDICRGKHSAG